ncbi:inner nuclear membrane protein SRC1 [Apiospora arundinis]
MESRRIISRKSLPLGSSVTFEKTSFFSRNGPDAEFPTPSTILAQSAVQAPSFQDCEERPPVYFEELGLVVKYGKEPKVNIAEAQCLWALKQVGPQIPVPEIYGWTHDTEYTYLFIKLVPGITLEKAWESLARPERVQLCEQLRSITIELRTLQHEPDDQFLGDISGGPLADIIFTSGNLPRAGPFVTTKEFHDWLSSMLKKDKGQHWPGVDPSEIPDPYRQGLPDDSPVVFTHADLHPSNILISTETPRRIVAIVDWQQSGWYPDYWEFCKAEYTADYTSEWVKEYIPRFIAEPECVETFEDYARALGY